MSTFHNIPVETLTNSLDNPAVLDWISMQLTVDRSKDEAMLRELFPADRLTRIMTDQPPEVCVSLLMELPPALLAGLEEELVGLVLRGGGGVAVAVPPLLIANDVDKGVELLGKLLDAFAERLEQAADAEDAEDAEDADAQQGTEADSDELYDLAEGMVAALEALAPERGLDLVDELLEESELLDPVQRARVAIAYDEEVADFLLDVFATEWPDELEQSELIDLPTFLLAEALMGSGRFLAHVAIELGAGEVALAEMAVLFAPEAPLDRLDAVIADEAGLDSDAVRELLDGAPTTSAVTTLRALFEIVDLESLDPMPAAGLQQLTMMAICEAWLRPADVARDCPASELVEGVFVALSPSPWLDVARERVSAGPCPGLAEAIASHLGHTGSPGGFFNMVDLVRAMDAGDLVPAILAWADGTKKPSPLPADQTPAEALMARWPRLAHSHRFLGQGVLAQVAPEVLVPFLVDHFEAHRQDLPDLELWCELASTTPDARLLPALVSQLHRGVEAVALTLFSVASLTAPDHPRLPEALERLALLDLDDDGRPSIELLLRCDACGDTNQYVFHHLPVEISSDAWNALLPADQPCASCGEPGHLVMTEPAEGEVELELVHLASLENGEDAQSPLELVARAQKPVVRATPKVGRNEPCPCGSGRKHKKCCGAD